MRYYRRLHHSRNTSSNTSESHHPCWYLAKVIASFHAHPHSRNQISVARDDVVDVTSINGERWLARNSSGETGYVPSKYLCLFDAHLTLFAASENSRIPTRPDRLPTNDAMVVKAAVSYHANPAFPEELSFQQDEVLEVAERTPGWFNARKSNGDIGIVPSPFFIYAEDARPPIQSTSTPSSEHSSGYSWDLEDTSASSNSQHSSNDYLDSDNRSETSDTTLVDIPDEFDLLSDLSIATAVVTALDEHPGCSSTDSGWR